MGLDVGIVLKANLENEKLPWFVNLESIDDGKVEICYWRKCWGIRGELHNLLHCPENGKVKIDREDIPAIERTIERYMDREYWDLYENSIWTYDGYTLRAVNNVKNLLWLGWYMDEHPDAEVYFYESY